MLTTLQYYGIVETIGGALKCALISGVCIWLYIVADRGIYSSSAQFLKLL